MNQMITFGLHLDGQRTAQPKNVIGFAIVGPLGFLDILETHLGLLANRLSEASRAVQYRACLEKCDDENRFYHRSFIVDPFGTAATLLKWRDDWVLHGWNGTAVSGAPHRVTDMADIEKLAVRMVDAGVSQRLIAVVNALQNRSVPIDSVSLVEHIEVFPSLWQKVLSFLEVQPAPEPTPNGSGFLRHVQGALLAARAGQQYEKLAWQDDGSVLIVQAESQSLAAQWVATSIEDSTPALLVCEHDGDQLDAYLSAAKLPRQGFKESSAFRPALQVLPLALELLWDPLNVYALVQFLTHSVCPIRPVARQLIAEKVVDAPGITGVRWKQTLAKIDEKVGVDLQAQVREEIATWLGHQRYSLTEGAPIPSVIARVAKLAEFFQKRVGDEDASRSSAFMAGLSQCRASQRTLAELLAQGQKIISARQLQKVVIQSTANGSANPLWPAQVGAKLCATIPGAVFEPVAKVIWWQMQMPVLPGSLPWSEAEVSALANSGAMLRSATSRLDQTVQSWLRLVLAAQEKLILVLPPPDTEVHPLWQMLCAVVDDVPVLGLEQYLADGGNAMTRQTYRPLPQAKRWWQLPKDLVVTLREKESFTSLEKFLFNPYHWLLQYPAKLQPSRLLSSGSDFRMMGLLAHGLVERFYFGADSLKMDDEAFNTWFSETFESIVDEEGAHLRMSGRKADLESFRFRLERAVKALRQHITNAKVIEVCPEEKLFGHFPGGELGGPADLLLRTSNGHTAIVDMKWGGCKKYGEKLKNNQHLQLAIYAELQRQTTGQFPSVAYFIFDDAQMLAPDNTTFENARVVPSINGENTAQLYQRFIETWRWRASQVEGGAFEVVLTGISDHDIEELPAEGLAGEVLNVAYNEYRSLAGWGSKS
ncbi:PD-(D/E)XK nuclease family protein [Candidatus Nitrotoga fabula]|uniref:PD-(D/E)XK nuclease family protein n=2 Tax=Candidatus Nitrotoga fabula TaxID=2182327 RepID=A0A916FC66_9PROT|nr:PD-(D/E)XK nuclease family protein [Candidatus Nitrotoga fabula]